MGTKWYWTQQGRKKAVTVENPEDELSILLDLHTGPPRRVGMGRGSWLLAVSPSSQTVSTPELKDAGLQMAPFLSTSPMPTAILPTSLCREKSKQAGS